MRLADRLSTPAFVITRYTVLSYIKERVLLVVRIFAFILMVSSYVLAPLAVGDHVQHIPVIVVLPIVESTASLVLGLVGPTPAVLLLQLFL